MTAILPLLLAAAALAAVVALIVAQRRAEARRRAAYQALAQRRGWDHAFQRARGGRPAELHFTDAARGIALVVTRRLSRKSGSVTTTKGGTTVVSLRRPRLAGALALYVPPSERDLLAAAGSVLGIFDNALGRMLVGRLAGEEIGDHLGQLTAQPVPAGLALGILASVDPAPFIDATPMAQALAAAPSPKAMILVSETGTRLRLGRALYEAAEIERLFDAALALDAALNGASQRPSS